MDAFTRKQAGVAAGMAGGLVLTVMALLWPELPGVPAGSTGRLAVWAACSATVGFWLLVAVGRLAGHRFFTPQDIDGGGIAGNSDKAALLQALIQNTLEQALLAIVAYGAWLMLGPSEMWGLVIVYAICFSAGRLLFFAGYSRGAPFRALGFTLTFYPTVALYLMLLPRIVSTFAEAL
jgi:uncharacterized membrane protein YecN with MAPEG domain